jgi:hypothetical protein
MDVPARVAIQTFHQPINQPTNQPHSSRKWIFVLVFGLFLRYINLARGTKTCHIRAENRHTVLIDGIAVLIHGR